MKNLLSVIGILFALNGFGQVYILNEDFATATGIIQLAQAGFKNGFNQQEILFSVYPNPATTSFTLKISGEEIQESILVSLYDVYGKLILGETIHGEVSHVFSVSHLPPGIYGLRISTGVNSESVKVIKSE